MSMIYHIAAADALAAARQTGVYRTESLSGEGFIHFSNLHQVLQVANRFYTGQNGLVLLEVDPSRLRAELKFEAPVHPASAAPLPGSGQLFPHLYGPLNLDAVVAVYDFVPKAGGKFSLPAGLIAKDDH